MPPRFWGCSNAERREFGSTCELSSSNTSLYWWEPQCSAFYYCIRVYEVQGTKWLCFVCSAFENPSKMTMAAIGGWVAVMAIARTQQNLLIDIGFKVLVEMT